VKISDAPHVKVYQEEGVTLLPVTAFESITHALLARADWWEGTTIYGVTFFVRCATVTDVHLVTQAALDLQKAEEEDASPPPWAQ
jgi:hypothetical protein